MAKVNDEVEDVAKLLEQTKVEQLNVVSFKGKSLKLNTAQDGKWQSKVLNNVFETYWLVVLTRYIILASSLCKSHSQCARPLLAEK